MVKKTITGDIPIVFSFVRGKRTVTEADLRNFIFESKTITKEQMPSDQTLLDLAVKIVYERAKGVSTVSALENLLNNGHVPITKHVFWDCSLMEINVRP